MPQRESALGPPGHPAFTPYAWFWELRTSSFLRGFSNLSTDSQTYSHNLLASSFLPVRLRM